MFVFVMTLQKSLFLNKLEIILVQSKTFYNKWCHIYFYFILCLNSLLYITKRKCYYIIHGIQPDITSNRYVLFTDIILHNDCWIQDYVHKATHMCYHEHLRQIQKNLKRLREPQGSFTDSAWCRYV